MDNSEQSQEEKVGNPSSIEIKPTEIFSFNLYIIITIFYIFYMSLCLLPQEIFVNYLHMDFLPDPYWYTAVPTHILVTLISIFCLIKGLELRKQSDNPIYKDDCYKELSIDEMKKEILYDKTEGILPDVGDLGPEVVKAILE